VREGRAPPAHRCPSGTGGTQTSDCAYAAVHRKRRLLRARGHRLPGHALVECGQLPVMNLRTRASAERRQRGTANHRYAPHFFFSAVIASSVDFNAGMIELTAGSCS
jgi:hypothetical protein